MLQQPDPLLPTQLQQHRVLRTTNSVKVEESEGRRSAKDGWVIDGGDLKIPDFGGNPQFWGVGSPTLMIPEAIGGTA